MTPRTVSPAFHIMAKPAGAACNLACTYCYFLSKGALYPGSDFRMSDEVLEAYLGQFLAAHQTPEVTIAWQGGEPTLMGLDFYRRSVQLIEKHRKPGQSVIHTIQTNGTLINDDWAAFFKAHNFLIGLSIDGPRELHNTYRMTRNGHGSFDQVLRGWEVLHRHNVDVNILCTVHAANGHRPRQIYRFFRDELQARYIQFIPIVERVTREMRNFAEGGWSAGPGDARPLYSQQGHIVTSRSIKPKQYGRFLIEVFEEWVRHDVGSVFVQTFDVTLGSILGQHNLCVFAPTCGQALALEHNGDLYTCDHYVEPDYRLGNILETPMTELAASERQRQFGRDKYQSLPAYCRQCDVLFACYGECPRNRFTKTPTGEQGLNYLCSGYKLFFHHVREPMMVMANLLREGRPAQEIMQWYAVQPPKLG